jgi:hypothetical protein
VLNGNSFRYCPLSGTKSSCGVNSNKAVGDMQLITDRQILAIILAAPALQAL